MCQYCPESPDHLGTHGNCGRVVILMGMLVWSASQPVGMGCWNILEFQAEQVELEKLTEPAGLKIYSPPKFPKNW